MDGASFIVKADGVTFSNVRGIGSLVVDKEVGEGGFSAEGCEVSAMLVNCGDIGSGGSTMTLEFELEGRAYTVSSETSVTTEFTYSEVTE